MELVSIHLVQTRPNKLLPRGLGTLREKCVGVPTLFVPTLLVFLRFKRLLLRARVRWCCAQVPGIFSTHGRSDEFTSP